jgi:hypothetical protein
MSDDRLRPIKGDPSGAQVVAMFDLKSEEWWLSRAGDYQTAAGETVSNDGAHWERVIMLEWPARVNHEHGPEAERTLRLLIAPEDALGLAEVLAHTAAWLMSLAELERPSN